MAAVAPPSPHPTVHIRIPYEGNAEVKFVASDDGELVRLFDWFSNGRYADLGAEALVALMRDRAS